MVYNGYCKQYDTDEHYHRHHRHDNKLQLTFAQFFRWFIVMAHRCLCIQYTK